MEYSFQNIEVRPLNYLKLEKLINATVLKKANEVFSVPRSAIFRNIVLNTFCEFYTMKKVYHQGKLQLLYLIPVSVKEIVSPTYEISKGIQFYWELYESDFKSFTFKAKFLKEYQGYDHQHTISIRANERKLFTYLNKNETTRTETKTDTRHDQS